MTKLTGEELELLTALTDGPLLITRYHPLNKPDMLQACVKRGWIVVVNCRHGSSIYALTDAGREARLAKSTG